MTKERGLHLAPTYDHASSLGRIETDAEKLDRLTARDKNRTVEAYLKKDLSAFYASPASVKPLSTFEAFESAARFYPFAALSWLKRLQDVSDDQTELIFRQIPSDRMSDVSIKFAQRILTLKRERLLSLVGTLL